ncbi:MAG: Peptidase [Lactococcus sp.]|jgi:dipeptidase E
MKKLFLSSSFDDVAHRLPAFIGDKLAGKVVTFIPTANVPQDYDGYVVSARAAFEALGLIIDELEVSTASASDIQSKLTQNDYIYVSGGNSFFLLQELKRTGADQLIIDQVNQGKLYIGESAGSIITSPDIAYISAMDSTKKAPELTSTQGLHLVEFYTLPHATNEPFEDDAQEIIAAYGEKIKLNPISNDQVILVLGDSIHVS